MVGGWCLVTDDSEWFISGSGINPFLILVSESVGCLRRI